LGRPGMAGFIPHRVARRTGRHSVTNCILAADSATNGPTPLEAAAVPFVAAIALFLISPLLVAKVKVAIIGQVAEEAGKLSVPEEQVPPHLTRECIDAYIEYAADAVQIIPLTLLPVTGAVFAIAAHVPSAIALGYLGIAVLAAVAVEAWVLSRAAGRYVALRFLCYSVVTAIGIASNLLGLAMIIFYGQ
jgi:hypothetical protein